MTINPEVPFLDGKGELATPTVLSQIDARTKATMRADLPALADELNIGGVDEGALQPVRDTAEAAKTTSNSAYREAQTAHALAKSVADGAGMGPGGVTDGAVAAVLGQSDTLARAAVGDVVGLWSPSRALAKGERVIAPNGSSVVATEAHTTGPAFDASKYIAAAPVTYALNPVSTKADVSRRVVYQESMTVAYAVSQSTAGTVWKTTDSGQTWEARGDIGFSVHTLTKVVGTGTLIAVELTNRGTAGLNPRVARSTDDGATWTQVTTLVHPGLGNQGILSPAPGVVLIAEYGNTGNTVFSVRRSADDGVTWTAVLSSPGTDGRNDPGHIHSVVRAPDGTIIAFMDRDVPEVYTSADQGATWKKIGTATKQHHPNWVAPMFFEKYIAWGNDNQADGRVFRLTYEDFYAGRWENPEVVAQLSNDRFYDTFPILPGVWAMIGATEIVDLTRAGTWAQETYLVYNEGASVAGGLSHAVPAVRLDAAALQRDQLPGYPAVPPDMGGRSFIMLSISNRPRPYVTVPYTVGRGPAMPHIMHGTVSDQLMAAETSLMWPSSDGTSVNRVLGRDGLNRVNFRNVDPGVTDAPGIRLFNKGAAGGALLTGETTKLSWKNDGVEALNNLFVNTSAGPSIATGTDSPEGVVTARLGSLYLQGNGTGATWYKAAGLLSNTGWQKIGGGGTSSGGTTRTIRTVTSDTTAGPADDLIVSNGASIVYLPAPSGGSIGTGGQVTVKNIASGTVTVRVAAGGALDGGTQATLAQWESKRFVNTGDRWLTL